MNAHYGFITSPARNEKPLETVRGHQKQAGTQLVHLYAAVRGPVQKVIGLMFNRLDHSVHVRFLFRIN